MVRSILFTDVSVEELIQFPEETGAYSYYRIEKNRTTLETVKEKLASRFKLTPSAVIFPALRDFKHKVVQYASVRKEGPRTIEGEGFKAQRIRNGSRALRASDLLGRRYIINVGPLGQGRSTSLTEWLYQLEKDGLPNYYSTHRFRTKTKHGFIGQAILKHQPLEVLQLYLSEPNLTDSAEVTAFKAEVKSHWGQWGYLLHKAPRPSNYRSVITYLKDKPMDYEKAINLIRDQRLAYFLETYQAWIWNKILANYLQMKGDKVAFMEIAGYEVPLLEIQVQKQLLKKMQFPLPRLTADYKGELADAAQAAIQDEGLTMDDFNVRLVRRVCCVKRKRSAWFAPANVEITSPALDNETADDGGMRVSFDLGVRQYGTLVMDAAFAYMDSE
jgi:tRNA(Glu) U13 pseudouridine synthase TruD